MAISTPAQKPRGAASSTRLDAIDRSIGAVTGLRRSAVLGYRCSRRKG
jgi:hypothetical protein